MVLEHLFPEDWLEKKVGYAFLIAVIYSTLGIVAARLLFGANSGIVSVIFTSLFILPYLQKMFKKEEHEEECEGKVKLAQKSMSGFFRRNQAIRVYAAIFLGIYLTYMLYSFFLPQLGFNTSSIFKEQLIIDLALRGRAFDAGTFFSIVANNWWVLLGCFLLAIVVGDGAIFFITWNASSWGALFGFRALNAAINGGANPLWYLILVFIITLPHVILEAGGYILAAISGNIISDEIIQKKSDITAFILYGIAGAALIVLFKLYYLYILNNHNNIVFSIICMVLITVMLRVFITVFKEPRLKKVFNNNYNLFILAIIIFLIGALVETFVINHSAILMRIYALSFMAT